VDVETFISTQGAKHYLVIFYTSSCQCGELLSQYIAMQCISLIQQKTKSQSRTLFC